MGGRFGEPSDDDEHFLLKSQSSEHESDITGQRSKEEGEKQRDDRLTWRFMDEKD